MREWIIRLNNRPIMRIKGPSYIDPQETAKQIIIRGKPDNDQVTWKWML